MVRLPNLSGQEILKILKKYDYELDHQTGSHLIIRQKNEPHRRLTIPNHNPVSIGTLNAIIKQSGLTREEFLKK
ncbi:MAG: type II toxin-antitoxin system HicA family toxin [Candidatus ainarchaeum sp.]|nr:type II toxin-antitoxin system HicA family toxin [Candidatus ainarchaeum sp.]